MLQVKAPSGHFFIDPDPQVPAVLIAGGIGITPMMSMLRWCLAEQPGRTLHLYYGVRHGGEHAFKLQLEQLADSHPNFHLSVVYSRPGPNDAPDRDYQHAGHVDIDLLRRTLPHGRHQFYVCGPAAMMESLVPALAPWGVPQPDHPLRSVRPGIGAFAGRHTPGASCGSGRPARPAFPPLWPHADVGRAGRNLARFRRTTRRGGRFGLPLGRLRNVRNETDFRPRALRQPAGA